MKRSLMATFSLALALSLPATAEQQAKMTGNAEAGKAKSATCLACHGPDGNSLIPAYPNLAGQVPGYITSQLKAFKSGERVDATMAPMAAPLSEQDILDLDAYYSNLPAKVGAIGKDQMEAMAMAEAIYRGGIKEHNVSACMACHGPAAKGIEPNYPRLSGQKAEYIEAELLAFKKGERTDPMMNPIAFSLSEEQIKLLAKYVSALY